MTKSTIFRSTLATILVAAGCHGQVGVDDAPQGVGGSSSSNSSSQASGQAEQPLYLAVTVHLEGWSVQDGSVYDIYTQDILDYSTQTGARGIHFTWEARNLIEPAAARNDDLFQVLQERGDGIGIHADLGGNPNAQLSDTQFREQLEEMRLGMETLGVKTRAVSGICSHLNWVKAARDAGFEVATGTVTYCLKSLPDDQQPAFAQACTNPAECHDPYPLEQQDRVHMWYASDGSDWTTPASTGLLIVPTIANLNCEDDPGTCAFTQADVDSARAAIETALAAKDPTQVNVAKFIWSFGRQLDKDVLDDWLDMVNEYVQDGRVVFKTIDAIRELATQSVSD